MNYRQCTLEKPCGQDFNGYQGVYKSVTFLPETFAVLNNTVKLRNEYKEWENGWVVKEVSSITVDEKHLPDPHSQIKSHRKQTGDNTPKVKE